jgi:hypothetical protein
LQASKMLKEKFAVLYANGAPERIRTSDPQIRSLVLYPAELRAPGAGRTSREAFSIEALSRNGNPWARILPGFSTPSPQCLADPADRFAAGERGIGVGECAAWCFGKRRAGWRRLFDRLGLLAQLAGPRRNEFTGIRP